MVGRLHHGRDASAQAALHGLQHGANVEIGRAVHREAVRAGLDLRHQQKGIPVLGMTCFERVPVFVIYYNRDFKSTTSPRHDAEKPFFL